jgi:hypothetical protein
MSPEQLNRPADIDYRSDLFALGTIMYELLSGVLPFAATSGESDDTQALGFRIIFQPHRPLRSVAPHAPDALIEIVERLLSKKPDERYPSAARVHDLLAAAHASFVRSLGELGPMPLAEAVAAIPRTAPKAEAASIPSLPTSTNPFITVSLPPEPPKEDAHTRRGAARSPDATTEELPGSAMVLPPLAAQGGPAAEPSPTEVVEEREAVVFDRSPSPPPLALATPTTSKLPVYVFVPPPSASGEFAPGAASPSAHEADVADAPPSSQEAPASQRVELLRRLIAELPDELRRPFVLNQIHEKTAEEIAELTGVPASTVRERVLAARALLGAKMAEAARRPVEVGAAADLPAPTIARADSTGSLASHVREVAVAEHRSAVAPARSRTAPRFAVGLVAVVVLGLAGYGGTRWRNTVASDSPDGGPDVAAVTTSSATSVPVPTEVPPQDSGTPVVPSTSTAPAPVEHVVRPTVAPVTSPAPVHTAQVPRLPARQPASPPVPTAAAPQPAPTASHRLFGTEP